MNIKIKMHKNIFLTTFYKSSCAHIGGGLVQSVHTVIFSDVVEVILTKLFFERKEGE